MPSGGGRMMRHDAGSPGLCPAALSATAVVAETRTSGSTDEPGSNRGSMPLGPRTTEAGQPAAAITQDAPTLRSGELAHPGHEPAVAKQARALSGIPIVVMPPFQESVTFAGVGHRKHACCSRTAQSGRMPSSQRLGWPFPTDHPATGLCRVDLNTAAGRSRCGGGFLGPLRR